MSVPVSVSWQRLASPGVPAGRDTLTAARERNTHAHTHALRFYPVSVTTGESGKGPTDRPGTSFISRAASLVRGSGPVRPHTGPPPRYSCSRQAAARPHLLLLYIAARAGGRGEEEGGRRGRGGGHCGPGGSRRASSRLQAACFRRHSRPMM